MPSGAKARMVKTRARAKEKARDKVRARDRVKDKDKVKARVRVKDRVRDKDRARAAVVRVRIPCRPIGAAAVPAARRDPASRERSMKLTHRSTSLANTWREAMEKFSSPGRIPVRVKPRCANSAIPVRAF